MKKILVFAIIVLAFGQVCYSQAGSSGLSFLKLGVGGRSVGMGEAVTANAIDASAMHYNPAALRMNQNAQLLVMHREWIQNTQVEYIGGSFVLGSVSLGASLNSTSIPDIEIRNVPGPPIGSFTARNAAVGLSAAYEFQEDLSIGLTAKYLYEKILIDEAEGLAVDIGAIYESPWGFTLGFSLANLGSMDALRSESSKLPTTFRIGASRAALVPEMESVVIVTADVVSITPEKSTHVHIGGEFNYKETFAIRAGYMTGYDSKRISLGAGFNYGLIKVDYAFIPFKFDFGSTHTFSLGIIF